MRLKEKKKKVHLATSSQRFIQKSMKFGGSASATRDIGSENPKLLDPSLRREGKKNGRKEKKTNKYFFNAVIRAEICRVGGGKIA